MRAAFRVSSSARPERPAEVSEAPRREPGEAARATARGEEESGRARGGGGVGSGAAGGRGRLGCRLGIRCGRGGPGRARGGGVLHARGFASERVDAARLLHVHPCPDRDDRGQHEPDVGPEGGVVVGQNLDEREDQDGRCDHRSEHGVRDGQSKVDARKARDEPGDERDGEEPEQDAPEAMPRVPAETGVDRHALLDFDVEVLPGEECVDQQQQPGHEHDLTAARERVEPFQGSASF